MVKESDRLSNVAYVGIGGCGRSMLKSWLPRLPDRALCMAVDRDKHSFVKSEDFEHRLLLTNLKSKGSSAEYSASVRNEIQASMAGHLTPLDDLLSDRDTVILLAGLGGVVGTWASQLLCNYLATMDKQVVTVLTMPFSFERERLKVAEAALSGFNGSAHRVLCFNDYLIRHTPEGTSMADAFALMNKQAFELLSMPE